MAQAKKKQSTKTAKKTTARKNVSHKKASTSTNRKQDDRNEKMHVYIVTAMSMIVGILLCANAAMLMV